jgi:hypothetical protein
MDQTVYLVVKCSIYISAVGLLKGDSWDDVKQNVQDRIGGIVVTAWKFWPLVHCITYGLIPARHRILWVNSVDLIWNAILASKAQRQENEPDTNTNSNAVAVDEALAKISVDETTYAPPDLINEVEIADSLFTQSQIILDNALTSIKEEDVVALEPFGDHASSRNSTFAALPLST